MGLHDPQKTVFFSLREVLWIIQYGYCRQRCWAFFNVYFSVLWGPRAKLHSPPLYRGSLHKLQKMETSTPCWVKPEFSIRHHYIVVSFFFAVWSLNRKNKYVIVFIVKILRRLAGVKAALGGFYSPRVPMWRRRGGRDVTLGCDLSTCLLRLSSDQSSFCQPSLPAGNSSIYVTPILLLLMLCLSPGYFY